MSVPLDVSGNREQVLGALNLYSEVADGFDDDDVEATKAFARQAAIVVANARAYWGTVELAEQLKQAMESRAGIEQAKASSWRRVASTPTTRSSCS